MVNVREKGKRFERYIAKLLTKTFKTKFYRVPQSGAFSTTNQTNDPRFNGDIFTENKRWNEVFNVVIECKTTKKLIQHDNSVAGLLKVLLSSKVRKYLEQCEKESKGKNFWLFIKENRKPVLVIEGFYNDKSKDYILSLPERINHFLRVKKKLWKKIKKGDKNGYGKCENKRSKGRWE